MISLKDLSCDYKSGAGFVENTRPQFSWKIISDARNTRQISYRIYVRAGQKKVWDSGTVFSDKSVYIPYQGAALMSLTIYTYEVTVTTSAGEATAEQTFETGLLSVPMSASWIYSGEVNDEHATLPIHTFRTRIVLKSDKTVERARLFAQALGIFDASVNGERVSQDYFAPGNANYKSHLPRVEYDVTHLMSDVTELTASVANGWYSGRVDLLNNFYGDIRAFRCELYIFYTDGSCDVIKTDKTWKWTDEGPVRAAEIYDGEVYDARETVSEYKNAKIVPLKYIKGLKETPYMGVPVVLHERITPVKIFVNSKGEKIYDMGQNFAGWVHLKTNAPCGTVITVSHAEILVGDNEFWNDNFRYAKAQLVYTCKGGGEEYEPRFTYMGFRYVKVEGADDVEITGVVVHSDIKRIGDFECSNPLLNQLHHNIIWSTKSNFFEIPTDCPQRDERLGWTGDITVFSPTAAFNYDIALFMRKWLYDLETEQENGIVPFCVPDVGCLKKEKTPTAGWSDAATFVPWAVYTEYGDIDSLSRQYESMKAWVEAENRQCNERMIWADGFQFGDWLAPDGGFKVWQSRAPWLASCYFAKSAEILAKTAGILGKKDDFYKYSKLCDDIKTAFVNEFVDKPTGTIRNGFQSAYVCALYFDMLPTEDMRKQTMADLLDDIKAHDGLLNTGFLGTPFLTFALCDNGHPDAAYDMLLQERCPSWLYQIKHGATTVWERWDGIKDDGSIHIHQNGNNDDNMVSFNHYAYGAVGSFLYKRIAGLQAVEPGYKTFKVKPFIGGGLTYAKVSHESPYGMIKCGWAKKGDNGDNGDRTEITVTVPANTTAIIELPNGQSYEIGSGEYTYTV